MKSSSPYGRALLGAASIIGVASALAWLTPGHVSAETARRIMGVLMGAVVVVYSNAIPKYLGPRARRHFHSAEDQAARRFAGWSMVLGGIGYMLAWLCAPLGSAALLGGIAVAAGLLAAIVRFLPVGSRRGGR